MPPTSSSLVVRLSVDLNDFTKGLTAATRDVDKAAKKIEGFGRALTLGITVPVAAAAVALAKMAAENEDTAGRMERVFGSAASSVNASIQKMMKSVPEANTDLQKMAISVDNMAQGLGLAPNNAAKMSESLLKLAGDASAFAHVPMADALDALSRGLAGKTKGLLQFGIAISEADIKAKALSMQLIHEGGELTETGTALAAYALIMEKSTRITGEAERTAGQMGKSFAFLKRDVGELADNVSHLVLPALSDLANKAKDVVGWFSKLDDSTVKAFFNIAAAAAVIIPVTVALVELTRVVFALRAAVTILSAGGGIAGLIAGIAAAPMATVVAGVVAITAALGALYLIWQKFKGGGSGPEAMFGEGKFVPHTTAQGVAAYQNGLQANAKGLLGGGNDATERTKPVDAMKALEDRVSGITSALKQVADGFVMPDLTVAWVKALGAVETALAGIKDKLSPLAAKMRDMSKGLIDAAAAAAGPLGANVDTSRIPGVGAATPATFSPANLTSRLPGPQVAELPGFTAANLAALRYADSQDYITERNAVAFQGLRQGLDQFGIHLKNVGERAQGAINILADGFLQLGMQLVANVGGKGPAAGTGRQLGGLGGAALGFFLGGPVGAIAGSIVGTGLGGLVGGLFDKPKRASDAAADSMTALAKTAERLNASISNMPQWFKIAGFRFAATSPIGIAPPPPAYTPPTPNTPGTPTDGGSPTDGATSNRSPVFHIQTLNVQSSASNVKQLLAEIEKAAFEKQATGAASGFAFAFQGT